MAGANDVNYATAGDNGTPGDWARIKQYADEYLANPTANLWQGSATQGDNYPVYEGIKLQQAAFCYLLMRESNATLANQYAAAVRNGLMQQITIRNADIAAWWNLNNTNEDGVNESRFYTRLTIAADYVKDYLAAADKAAIDAYLLRQANFMAAQIQSMGPGKNFPRRLFDDYTTVSADAKPGGESYGIWPRGNYPDGFQYTHVNANGTLGNRISYLALDWNNRNADKATFVGVAGYYLNNTSLIFQAKQYTKEWIRYSVYPDGTQGEYERNGDYTLPQQGMAYSAINLWQAILLADMGARRGDFEIYNYQTREGLHGTQVPTGGAPKTLRLAVEKYCHNIQANPAIYDRTVTANQRLDSYGEVANVELVWDVLFSVPNKFWKSDYITSIYTRTAPGVRPYPTNGTGVSSAARVWYPWGGTGAEMPGVLFQNGQMEHLVDAYAATASLEVASGLSVPFTLQRTTQLRWRHTRGAVRYNVRYRATSTTTWTSVNNVLFTWMDLNGLVPNTQYEWQVQAVGAATTAAWSASAFFATPASCTGQSRIVRELWSNQTNYFIWQTDRLPFASAPTSTSNLTSLEGATNTGGTNYAVRTRGFVCAPQTGAYTFWVSGDDEAELYLSTDDSPANAVRIASTKWTNPREFGKYSTQRSTAINLIANQRYYIEVRQLQVSGGDHFCVRWQMPDGVTETPIAPSRISPFSNNNLPAVSISTDRTSYATGESAVLTASAADADGTVLRVEFFNGSTRIASVDRAPYTFTVANLPNGNYTFSARAVDNTGAFSSSAGALVAVSAAPQPAPPSTCASGSISVATWTGITGNAVASVPFANPNSTSTITALEINTNVGDNLGRRIRGFICPPTTGTYTFWIAADDQAQLWLSTNEDSTFRRLIASNNGATSFRNYTATAAQQSTPIQLIAGQQYYIEVVHKEGVGTDHVSVRWQMPGGAMEAPIPGTRLSPFTAPINYTCTASGSITRETWNNVSGDISTFNWSAAASWRGRNNSTEPPRDFADNYAQRLRGFICAPVTGRYTFMLSADDQAEFWMSNNDLAANAVRLASVSASTGYRNFGVNPAQRVTVDMIANKRYYIEIRHREGTGSDNVTLAWTLPSGMTETPIPGSRLSTMPTGTAREGVEEQEDADSPSSVATPAPALRFNLYPNPAHNAITLEASADGEDQTWEVVLSSHIGQELRRYSPALSAGERKIELNLQELNLSPGAYLVRVRDGQGKVHNLRFIKAD